MSPVIVFLSVFVNSSCNVGHNDDGICKIVSSVFCFPASGKLNYIHQITPKRQRCPDVAFIGRSNDVAQETEHC